MGFAAPSLPGRQRALSSTLSPLQRRLNPRAGLAARIDLAAGGSVPFAGACRYWAVFCVKSG